MKDNFTNPMLAELTRLTRDVMKSAQIGDKERQVFLLFYNEMYKVRRESIPKFQIFGTLCDGKLEGGWYEIMMGAEVALRHLKEVGWIEAAPLSPVGNLAKDKVGPAIETYKLTAEVT